MTRRMTPTKTLVLTALAVVAAAASTGCSKDKRYANEGDTGAAPPAAKPDLSETKGAPDSTAGHSARTNAPGVSGDSLGRRKETDNTTKAPAKKP